MAGGVNVSPQGIEWPEQREKPFWSTVDNLTKHQIDWIRESDELVLRRGQTLKWNADLGQLEWLDNFYIVGARANAALTISGSGNLAVSNGEFVWVVPTSRPITAETVSLAAGIATAIPRSAIVLGYVNDDVFYALLSTDKGESLFDNRTNPSSLGTIASLNSAKVQISCARHLRGVCQALEFKRTAGVAEDCTLELYDDDPDTTGELIYQLPTTNIPPIDTEWVASGIYKDQNLWYFELASSGSMWAKVTNNSAVSGDFTVGLRFREED